MPRKPQRIATVQHIVVKKIIIESDPADVTAAKRKHVPNGYKLTDYIDLIAPNGGVKAIRKYEKITRTRKRKVSA